MSITLGYLYEILRNKENYHMELLAGKKGLSNQMSWVHIIETDEITDFFEGGELIFTLGLNMQNEERLFEFIKKIYMSGAVGVVVNVGKYICSISEKIIDFCNQENFPLFTIPWNVYIAKVMNVCSREIMTYEKKKIEIVMAFKNAVFAKENFALHASVLEQYGFHEEWAYCVAVFDYFSNDEDLMQLELDRMCRRFEKNLIRMENRTYIFPSGNQIVIIFTNQKDEDILNKVKELNGYNLELKSKGIKVYAGVGRNTKSIRCIHKTYLLAQRIAHLMKRKDKDYIVSSYKSIGMNKIFLLNDDTEILRNYYSETLEPLVIYDTMNGTEYVDFLKKFFDCNCSAKETSEKLFIHRNTINYKIHKIEEVLGCSLSEFEERASLYVALKIREIL